MTTSTFVTKVTLSTAVAGPDEAAPDEPVWIISYTKSQHGREQHYRVTDYSETGARRMVRNLVADRAPGLSVEDVFTDNTGCK